ncbi:MAG: hypothetical protein IT307_19670 [Chloroflexi bacterium]|nr:hypothetical protein [Chloroflexota bacterium]
MGTVGWKQMVVGAACLLLGLPTAGVAHADGGPFGGWLTNQGQRGPIQQERAGWQDGLSALGFGNRSGGLDGILGGGELLGEAASFLNLDIVDLLRELPGRSLKQVAQEHNVDVRDLADDLKQFAKARINALRDDGRLSEEQANMLRDGVAEVVDDLLDHKFPSFGLKR